MNRQNSSYDLFTLASDAESVKMIIDSANAKYNNSMWRAFTDVQAPRRSKKFSSIVEETGIVVKASVLGGIDKKPLRSTEGAQKHDYSMPKIGHGFKVDQSDINYIEELNLVNTDMGDQILKTYLKRATNLLGGFHASWNSWVFEALSDQQITLDNLGGKKQVVDLNVAGKLKLKAMGSKPWFDQSGDGYDIIKDLVRMDKYADDNTNMSADRVFVCSKDLKDKILTDPKVMSMVGSFRGFEAGAFVPEAMVMDTITRAFGLPPIVAIDEKSRIEVDGIATDAPDSFNKAKITLVPASKLFDMHNSPSDYEKDQNPSTVKSFTEGGLIGSLVKYGSEPIEVVTNMEAWSFITFKNPLNIVTLDSSKNSATGL